MPTLELVDIWKSFGKVQVLKGVNLRVEEGEFVVLLGPSGSGKTTLLRIIAGLEIQDKGHVKIGEKIVDDLTPRERNVAMVFQNYALYPHKTVFENIALPLQTRKMKKDEIESKVKEVAGLLEIEGLLDRYPRQLSGGQQQRVALARALVRRPQLFLLDEPLSNLDAKVRITTRTFLKKLQKDLKITTIYVTHDQSEAMALADRIAVIHEGLVQQYDNPLNLYEYPANEFVAGFIGSPPINMIAARSEKGKIKLLNGELKTYVDFEGEVKVGIRPENIKISEDGQLSGKVLVIEPLGSESIITIVADSQEIKVKTSPEIKVKIGEDVKLRIDKFLVFKEGKLVYPTPSALQPITP
ncbi:MAG: ABC transporter ATP-binding protein [Nitrososphaeria archaeon]|nr:ABC transporter ATP-binding protein [Conexivisphaerales archaeon]